MNSKKEWYTKLIRIRYLDKTFDIFSDQEHRKAFLEVKVENGNEKYCYPLLKDYIELNNIYNKPFDGILYESKYTFQRKVYIAAIGVGVVLTLASIAGLHEINESYKLQTEMANYKVKIEDEPEIQVVKIKTCKELDDFGIKSVTFQDLRTTLSLNQQIEPKYREYINEYIDCLEERLPDADYRVFNLNLKRLIFHNDYISDKYDGNFDSINGIINVKEKYLDKNGNEDLEREKTVVFHELTHTLNYGEFELENDVNNIIIIHKDFSIGNYGNSFSESLTTILTDYLLTEDYKDYFSKEDGSYASYHETSSFCYQVMKLLDGTYTLNDFIHYDISYLETKLKNNALNNAIDILDTFHNSIYNDQEITIEEQREYVDLKQSIYESNLIRELAKEPSVIKKLKMVEVIPDKIGNKNQYVEIILNQDPENEFIRPIDVNETLNEVWITIQNEEGTETKKIINKVSTILIVGKDKTEKYQGFLPDLKVYRVKKDNEIEYHFGHKEEEKIRDFETGNLLEIDEIDMISLVGILPFYDYEIQNEILETEDFCEILQEEFTRHEENVLKQREISKQREEERLERKQKLSISILPKIEEAIENKNTDLEMIRMILENVQEEQDIPIAMELLEERNPEALLKCIDLIKDIGDERIIIEDQQEFYDYLSQNAVIYMIEEDGGIRYHLGTCSASDDEKGFILTDIDKTETQISECINQKTVPLSEVIPEIEKYRFSMEREFLESEEFIELMDGKIIESSDSIIKSEPELSHNIK